MKTLKIKYTVEGVEGIGIDAKGNVWRLPFKDAKGRNWGPKKLKVVMHSNLPAYRINNRYKSRKQLDSLRQLNEQVIKY